MAAESFVSYLSGIITLPPKLVEELRLVLKEEHYKSHQVIFVGGQPENRICFFQAGFARNYYYDEAGDEQTVKFYGPNDILFSHQGYWNQPAFFYTEILEDTTAITLRYQDLQSLLNTFPEVGLLTRTILNRFHAEEYEKQKLVNLTAEQRFREMRKNHRIVFQKAPLRMIASYLHMSRETLSRMIAKA